MSSLLKTSALCVSIGDVLVCQDLTWEVQSHETWAILGLNGIGKTTLLNTLSALHKADSGQIFVKQQPLASYSSKQLAHSVGYLFQTLPHDFPHSVFEFCSNALHPQIQRWQNLSAEDHDKVHQALIRVGLENFQQRQLNTLSGGEKKRAEIAGLLVQQPDIWLLDEPVNHLDIHHQVTMMQTLIDAARNKQGAIISILHDANLALRFCSHILLLQGDGQYKTGNAKDMLTEENLSQLYRHPVSAICQQDKKAFLPD